MIYKNCNQFYRVPGQTEWLPWYAKTTVNLTDSKLVIEYVYDNEAFHWIGPAKDGIYHVTEYEQRTRKAVGSGILSVDRDTLRGKYTEYGEDGEWKIVLRE